MALFRNRVFAHTTKLKILRQEHPEFGVGLKPHKQWSLQERGRDLRGIRKTGTGHVKMEQTVEPCGHELRTPGPQRLQEAGRRL